MFTPKQYRDKADAHTKLANAATNHSEREEHRKMQRSFSVMADNEQWLSDNHDQTVHAPPDASEGKHRDGLAADNAGSVGPLLDSQALRAQIARFLHKHKNNETHAGDV